MSYRPDLEEIDEDVLSLRRFVPLKSSPSPWFLTTRNYPRKNLQYPVVIIFQCILDKLFYWPWMPLTRHATLIVARIFDVAFARWGACTRAGARPLTLYVLLEVLAHGWHWNKGVRRRHWVELGKTLVRDIEATTMWN